MGSKPRNPRECVAACSLLTACAMTQPLPPRDPVPWPDTFAAGSAVAHDIPLRRPLGTTAEQERQAAARRVPIDLRSAAFDDRDLLLSQLPCAAAWVMPIPAAKTECATHSRFAASLRINP